MCFVSHLEIPPTIQLLFKVYASLLQLVKKGASEYGDTWRYRAPEADGEVTDPAWSQQEKKLKEDFGKQLRLDSIHLNVSSVARDHRCVLPMLPELCEGCYKLQHSVSTYVVSA